MKVEVDLSDLQVAAIVKRGKSFGRPVGREIVITTADRHAIEEVFQTTITDGADLAKRIRELASIQIGNIEHIFAPAEIHRLRMQAEFHGRDLDTYLREMVKELADRMLENT